MCNIKIWIRVNHILVDTSGKTIGANITIKSSISQVKSGTRNCRLEDLKLLRTRFDGVLEVSNAIIDKNGYVRAKSGRLSKRKLLRSTENEESNKRRKAEEKRIQMNYGKRF